MQLPRGERDKKIFEKGTNIVFEKGLKIGEKNFESMFYETGGGLNPKSVGGCEIF